MLQTVQRAQATAASNSTADLVTLPKRRWQRPLVIALAVLALCGGGLLLRFGPWSNKQRDLTAFTTTSKKGVLSGVITASGELMAVRKVNVSPRQQGRLQQLLVDEGDQVEINQLLAVMDDGDLDDRIQERQALLRQTEANYRSSKDDFDRRGQLFRMGVISADDFSDVQNQMLANREAVVAARERVEQLDDVRDELQIRAPFAGTITARYAEPGAFVTPTTTASANAGATSSSIVELSQGLEVAAKVPESDIGRIAEGQRADVRVDAYPDERFAARVSEIAPRAEKKDNVTSFEVTLELLNPPKKLRIGMTADINFETGTSTPRVLVPTVAIVTEDGKPGVLTVGADDQPSFQPVDLGNSSGDQTAILDGLDPETRVFIDLPPWANQRRD